MDRIASPQDLQTELRRIMAYSQGQRPSRDRLARELRTLADKLSSTRTASSGYDTLMRLLGGEEAYRELYERMDEDEQSQQLFHEVVRKLADEMNISSGAEEALNRLHGLVTRGKTWDIGLIRNNVFKAAHSLGLKLPSGMF